MPKSFLDFLNEESLNEGKPAKAKEYYDQIFYALKAKTFSDSIKDGVNHIRSFDIKLNNTGLVIEYDVDNMYARMSKEEEAEACLKSIHKALRENTLEFIIFSIDKISEKYNKSKDMYSVTARFKITDFDTEKYLDTLANTVYRLDAVELNEIILEIARDIYK